MMMVKQLLKGGGGFFKGKFSAHTTDASNVHLSTEDLTGGNDYYLVPFLDKVRAAL